MAQGPSQRRLNKAHTARAACERLPEALDQPADDFTCSIKAVHATHSLSTVQAEAAGVSPAINILVVDLEHLRRWLPEHALVRSATVMCMRSFFGICFGHFLHLPTIAAFG